MAVHLNGGGSVAAVHFPLDFNTSGPDNLGAKAMKMHIEFMKRNNIDVCFGDFNTITGNIADSIHEEFARCGAGYRLLLGRQITFLASFFDTVKVDINNPDDPLLEPLILTCPNQIERMNKSF